MRSSTRCRFCFAAFAIPATMCCAEIALADEGNEEQQTLTDEKQKLGVFLFSALKDSREKLRSGVCQISETVERTRRTGETIRTTATIFCAFDYDKRLLRYDYERDEPPEASRFFRTPKHSVLYSSGAKYMIVGDSSEELLKRYSIKSLDPRVIGTTSMSLHKRTFEEIFEFHTQQARLTDVREEATGRFHLILSHAPSELIVIEQHIWLDGEKAHVPVRYQHRYFNTKTEEWSDTLDVVETTWSKESDIWVPETVHGANKKTVWDLHFTWKSVNKGVPDALFQKNNLDAKDGTIIVDSNLDENKPVVLGVIGQDQQTPVDELESDAGAWRKSLILINVVIFALVILAYLWNRAKRSRSGRSEGAEK